MTRLRNKLDMERVEQFAQAHAAWLTYMETWAQFEADFYKGGSISPTIYGGSAAAMARTRVDELKQHLRSYDLLG